jgi:HPt (histidine-containing phosphotransfer) domain-containing protein
MTQQESIFTMLQELTDQLDSPTVVELVELYFENTTATLAKIKAAAATGNLNQLSKEAHALKSSSANLGAEALSAVCLQIERSQQLSPYTEALIQEAEQFFAEASTTMKKWIANSR